MAKYVGDLFEIRWRTKPPLPPSSTLVRRNAYIYFPYVFDLLQAPYIVERVLYFLWVGVIFFPLCNIYYGKIYCRRTGPISCAVSILRQRLSLANVYIVVVVVVVMNSFVTRSSRSSPASQATQQPAFEPYHRVASRRLALADSFVESMDRRALEGREKVLGRQLPDTLNSVSQLRSLLLR